MEHQLAQVQASVASLRALLSGPADRQPTRIRSIPAVTALAIAEMVTVPDLEPWLAGAFADLSAALEAGGLRRAGCFGALYPGDFFELEQAEVMVFLPIETQGVCPACCGHNLGRAGLREVPAVEAAVVVHHGSAADTDRTYADLGTTVAERAIGIDGPIREYYLTGFADPDESTHRIEICWPVFRTTSG
jgi:effector-binding domain-containing protein